MALLMINLCRISEKRKHITAVLKWQLLVHRNNGALYASRSCTIRTSVFYLGVSRFGVGLPLVVIELGEAS